MLVTRNFFKLTVLSISLISLLFACSQEKDPVLLLEEGKYQKAYKLFLPLAKNGDAEAQNYLGIIYYLGLLGEHDKESAFKWYEKAAKQKHASAQLNLGRLIETKADQPGDYMRAYMWYYASMENGNKEARKNIRLLLETLKLFPNQVRYAEKNAIEYINDKINKK